MSRAVRGSALRGWSVVCLAVLLAVLLAPSGVAIPPDGAGPDTPGTGASVSPRTLRAGEVLSFSVTGFPAGETVYIKIDDGQQCDSAAVHGACVYHRQAIDSRGRASGSFVLPAELATGAHWLRFLASAELLDADGNYLGVEGYTRRGGADFTVTAGEAAPRPDEPGAGEPDGSTADGAGADGTLVIDLGDVTLAEPEPESEPSPTPSTPAPTPTPTSTTGPDDAVATAVQPPAPRTPWLGIAGLAVAVIVAAALGVARRRRPGA